MVEKDAKADGPGFEGRKKLRGAQRSDDDG